MPSAVPRSPLRKAAADRADVLARFAGIAPAEHRGRRAPHKPLLLLWALGQLQALGRTEIDFADAEKPVDGLLAEFGPPWRTTAMYPFWHLQADRVWTVINAAELERRKGKDRPTLKAIRRARGRFDPEVLAALREDPTLIGEAALLLLEGHFESSLHDAIATAVGLELASLAQLLPARRRDPAFRGQVLTAYEYRCAVCDWSVFVGRDPVGLDAAHLRWHALGGADDLENGLCLCSLHHVALDRGAISISAGSTLLVSSEVHERSGASNLLQLTGRPVRPPQAGFSTLHPSHAAWHRAQVFRGPARP